MATGRIGVTPTLRTRWSKAPAGGTTSLSGLDDNSISLVYDVGFEAVYRNGVLLSRGNDYTATNGTTITLIDATITGDIIEVFANQAIPLTSTYTQAVADGKFINNTLVDAKGDIITATAADTPARLAVGTDGQVLTAASTTSTGLQWTTLSVSPVSATSSVATAQSTTSSAFTDLATSGPAVTLTTGTKALIIVTAEMDNGNNTGSRGEYDFAVSGATTRAASSDTAAQMADSPAMAADKGFRYSVVTNLTTLTAGSNTFTAKYRSPDSGTITFRSRSIFVMDLGS